MIEARHALVLWALIVGLVASCDPGPEEVQPASRAAMVELSQAPVSLEWATQKATARCMSRAGFEYPQYDLFRPTSQATGSLGGFLSPLAVQQAQSNGFEGRISGGAQPQLEPEEALRAYLSTLSRSRRARYETTLDDSSSRQVLIRLPDGAEVGAFSGGCVAEGRRAIYGSVHNFLRLFYFPQQINQFGEEASNDSSTRAALSRYSDCMQQAGYEVQSPSDALDVAQKRFGSTRVAGSPPSDAERAMAVAEARCESSSRFYKVLNASLIRAASSWLNDHEGEILALADLQRAALRRAKRTLEAPL